MAKKFPYRGSEVTIFEILDICVERDYYVPGHTSIYNWLKSGMTVAAIFKKVKKMKPRVPEDEEKARIKREEKAKLKATLDEFIKIGDQEDEFRRKKWYMEK